jgi:hypothetical protein
MYIRCQNTQKTRGKKKKKNSRKKRLENRCILDVRKRFGKYAYCPKPIAPCTGLVVLLAPNLKTKQI